MLQLPPLEVVVTTIKKGYTIVDERDVTLYFSNFCDRAEAGESFVITRGGKPAAYMLAMGAPNPDSVSSLAARIIWKPHEQLPRAYVAWVDDEEVGFAYEQGALSVDFPRRGEERMLEQRTASIGWDDDLVRPCLLEPIGLAIAERLLRWPRYELGQRVRYAFGGARKGGGFDGEGVVVRQPIPGNYGPPSMRYRVRHDGGTETRYVEVGVLEYEIVEVLT